MRPPASTERESRAHLVGEGGGAPKGGRHSTIYVSTTFIAYTVSDTLESMLFTDVLPCCPRSTSQVGAVSRELYGRLFRRVVLRDVWWLAARRRGVRRKWSVFSNPPSQQHSRFLPQRPDCSLPVPVVVAAGVVCCRWLPQRCFVLEHTVTELVDVSSSSSSIIVLMSKI